MNLIAVIAIVLAQTGAPLPAPDLSTPEKTVESFVAAYQKLDLTRAATHVYGVKLDAPMRAALNRMAPSMREQLSALLSLNLQHIRVEKSGEEMEATAWTLCHLQNGRCTTNMLV